MRLFVAARTRYAEDALAAAVFGGTTQLLVLGAGLDAFAYRNPYPRLRVFEVDHPSTQAWKRERLAAGGLPTPARLTYVPVDLARQPLDEALAAGGFEPHRRTFVSWLGAVPHLPDDVVTAVLRYVGGLPGGAYLVFDYREAARPAPPPARGARPTVGSRGHRPGTRPDPAPGPAPGFAGASAAVLASRLHAFGFTGVEDLGPPQIGARYLAGPDTPLDPPGVHIVRAWH